MKEVLCFLSKRFASHTVKYCKFGVVEEKSVSVLVQNRTPAWKIVELVPRGGYTIAESNQCLSSRCGRNQALCTALWIFRRARTHPETGTIGQKDHKCCGKRGAMLQ